MSTVRVNGDLRFTDTLVCELARRVLLLKTGRDCDRTKNLRKLLANWKRCIYDCHLLFLSWRIIFLRLRTVMLLTSLGVTMCRLLALLDSRERLRSGTFTVHARTNDLVTARQ